MEYGRNKCELCGQGLKKSGPYAPRKKEGEPAHKGPLPVYYTCENNRCGQFGKSVEVME